MHNIYSCVDSFTSLLNVQYLFILGRKNTSVSLHFCRSFFPETNRNYDRNLPSWTLLYKEKTNISTGNSIILFNKLNPSNI